MTGYRDDRAALKKRNEELEGELAELRAQLATRTQRDDAPAPLVTGEAERALPTRLIVVGLVALTAAAWLGAGPVVGSELAAVVVAASVVVAVLSRLFVVPGPHEVVVVSGTADPVRIVRDSFFRMPLIHATHPLELEARLVTLAVDNAYSKGGVPLQLRGYAIVGIDPEEPGVRRAVEHFLGTADIEKVVGQALEGAAREMIAELTPEELSVDRLKATQRLRDDAEEAMARLGLVVLDLGIEDVIDGVGYLDGLPRTRIASALREAELIDHEESAR